MKKVDDLIIHSYAVFRQDKALLGVPWRPASETNSVNNLSNSQNWQRTRFKENVIIEQGPR